MASTGTLTTRTLRKHLGVADGFVLYTTAVLGQSLIVLPSIAARQSGPWSILVWAGLGVFSYPIARVMAELGMRYPSAGGITAFISAGLGKRFGELTGVIYLMAIAIGAPVAAVFLSDYFVKLLPVTASARPWITICALALPLIINGFEVSALIRIQRWGFIACLIAVGISIVCALPHLEPARFTDIQGYTPADVLATGLLCFFAFVGWENASFSGEEFADRATLIKALGSAVVAVGAIFVLLGVAVVGSLSRPVIATSDASLSDLLQVSIGPAAAQLAAGIAVLIMCLLMISWMRGASRLIVSLARDSVLPPALARVHSKSGTPRRALLALGLMVAIGMAAYILGSSHVEVFLRLASASFVMTYVIIFVAAWRLLEIRRFGLLLAIASLGILILVAASFQNLWYIVIGVALYGVLLALRPWFSRKAPGDGEKMAQYP